MTAAHSPAGQTTKEALPSAYDPTLSAFMSIVDRLEGIVEAETESLSRNYPVRIGETGHRKRQGMLELGRAIRMVSKTGPTPLVQERLSQFAIKLEQNRRMLDIHLRAVRDVADIIAKAMREADSDGTYSRAAIHP